MWHRNTSVWHRLTATMMGIGRGIVLISAISVLLGWVVKETTASLKIERIIF
jgi:hypothetical protein